jgi:hypothetical protein
MVVAADEDGAGPDHVRVAVGHHALDHCHGAVLGQAEHDDVALLGNEGRAREPGASHSELRHQHEVTRLERPFHARTRDTECVRRAGVERRRDRERQNDPVPQPAGYAP